MKGSYNLDIIAADSERDISTQLVVRLGKGEADIGKEQEIPKMLDFSVLENSESKFLNCIHRPFRKLDGRLLCSMSVKR